MPEPDCDNDAQGVLIVVERNSGWRAWNRSIPAWAGEPVTANAAKVPVAVYPRVGGGTVTRGMVPVLSGGLSPRGRGNHEQRSPRRAAWAGEP